MRNPLIIAGMLLVSACQPAPSPPRAFDSGTTRILSAESPITACSMDMSHGDQRWTPTNDDVGTLEPVLIELIEYRLKEQNLAYGDTSAMQPERYHRDYYGFADGGWRFILVCGRYDAEPIFIRDGGPQQFGAIFDTRRRLFTRFEFGYRA